MAWSSAFKYAGEQKPGGLTARRVGSEGTSVLRRAGTSTGVGMRSVL
jgi:hypothetical protein